MDQDTTANDNASNVENDQSQTDTSAQAEEMVPVTKLKELEDTNRQLFERAKKAEGFVKVDGKWVKAPKAEEAVAAVAKAEATTGELNETQLFLLETKGITEDDDIALVQGVMKRTGQTIREALKDEYVLSKLDAARKAREVKAAIPSSTKRAGAGSADNADYWLQKIDAGNAKLGDIPDFKTKQAVVEALDRRNGDEKVPPWRR